jgi:UDP-2,4-diacetamido-2,4,6-trideoxy-beta-L-altropyranose hydrolase
MKVVFRADASIEMGTGHVMRCLALADELKRHGHKCSFICRDHPGHLGKLIADKGFGLDLLKVRDFEDSRFSENNGTRHAKWLGVSWEVDARQSQEALGDTNPEWLIVDHYALDGHWERQVGPSVGRIMGIDDLADREHQVDLLLDQNLGRTANDYNELLPDHCIRLIGPRYALLRSEFSEFRVRSLRRREKAELGRILISMGGTDTPNTTASVLQALEASDLPSTLNLDVIMGSTAPWLDQIHHLSDISRFDINVSTDVRAMAERMCLADLSIGAAGSTSWERCVLALPSIVVSQAYNQSEILEALSGAGAAEKLDFPFDDMELFRILNRFLKAPEKLSAMAKNAARICDGMGVGRVFERLNAKK